MGQYSRGGSWIVIAGLACAMLAGCSMGTPSSGDSSGIVSRALEWAREGGADPEQIAILEKGEVSFADYESAVNRTLQCMHDAGIDVLGPTLDNSTGLTILNYSWSPELPGMSEDQGTAIGDDCIDRYSHWVETSWQLQPSSMEAKERFFDGYRETIVACIRQNGGTVKDDVTREETAIAATDVVNKTGVDCFTQAGISR